MSINPPFDTNGRPGRQENGEYRCVKCGKLLAKGALNTAVLEIKCHRCGTLNSLLEKMSDQVIITDAEGIILYANEQLEKVSGYRLSEVIGQKPSLWGGQMSQEFYRQLWHKIKVEKRSMAVKLFNRRKDGTTYQAHLRISPVLDAQGEVKFFVGMETIIKKDDEV